MKLYFISTDTVSEAVAAAEFPALQSVPGTMTLHQLVVSGCVPGALTYRDVSCFWAEDLSSACSCFDRKSFTFQLTKTDPPSSFEPCSVAADEQNVVLSAAAPASAILQTPSRCDATLVGQ